MGVGTMRRNMTRAERFSYFFIFLVIVLAGALHLAPPLVTVLFSYFALHKLNISKNRWLTVILFLVLIGTISYGIFSLVKQAIEALPKIGSESIPSIVAYAQSKNIDLPFSDFESFKGLIMDTAKDEFKIVGTFARAATKQFIFLVIGAVVALGLFLNPSVDTDARKHGPNLFTSVVDQITNRFACFYESFERATGDLHDKHGVDGDFCAGDPSEARWCRHRADVPLRAAPDHRQPDQQYDHCVHCIHDFAEGSDRGAGFPDRIAQARVFPEQQDHWRADQESGLAHAAGPDSWRTPDGDPGDDPGARDPSLSQGRNFQASCFDGPGARFNGLRASFWNLKSGFTTGKFPLPLSICSMQEDLL
jgi:hypothetical protein